jgi:arylesterase/paraoxonase
MWRRRALAGLGALAALLAVAVVKTLHDAGAFRRIEPHFAGSCRPVRGAIGPEDLTIHPRTNVAFVSAYDRRAAERGEPRPGAIYSYRLSDPAARLENLTPDAGIDFQPHGLSLWVGEDGHDGLFVVNHPAPRPGGPRHTIEVFDVVGEALQHRRSLTDPALLVMPNDLVAVGPDRFYVTNTHANPPGLAQTLETYLQLRRARVVFFDGTAFRSAIDGLQLPNGINRSADGRRLFVASSTGRAVREYARDPDTESLRFVREIFVGSGVDNIEVDAAGDLWIGAHPNLLAVPRLMADPAARSPSEVVRVSPATGAVEEIYLDDGSQISGSSVAAVSGDRLLIGQIFGDGILDCTMSR